MENKLRGDERIKAGGTRRTINKCEPGECRKNYVGTKESEQDQKVKKYASPWSYKNEIAGTNIEISVENELTVQKHAVE